MYRLVVPYAKMLETIYLFFLTLMLIVRFIPVFGESVRIAIAGVLFLFLCVFLYWKGGKIPRSYYVIWVLIILLYFLISSFWALNPILCFWVIFGQLFPIFVMNFSMFLYASDNRSNVYKLLAVFYVAAVMMLSFVMLKLDLSGLDGKRVTEVMDIDTEGWNSNAIGLVLCLAIYCGYILRIKLGKFFKYSYYLVAIAMLYVILLTGSRKSLLMLLIPVFCFSAYNLRKHFFKVLIVTIVLCSLLFFLVMKVPLFYDIIGVRMEDLFNIASNNTDGTEDVSRVMLIVYGWGWFLEHPILGVGVNNFRFLSNATPLFAGKNFYAHNNYIDLLVGCGLIGLFLYYTAHLYLFQKSFRLQNMTSKWVISFLMVTFFADMAMVSYYDTMVQFLLCICFIVIYQEYKISTNNLSN